MRCFAAIIFLVACSSRTFGNQADSIVYRIHEKQIHISSLDSEIVFNVTLTNHTKFNLDLYGFKKTLVGNTDLDSSFYQLLTQPGMGTGNEMIILNSNGTRADINIDWDVNIDDRSGHNEEVHKGGIDGIREDISTLFVKTKISVLKGTKVQAKVSVSIPKAFLKKGEYRFFMIYFSQSNVSDIVTGEHKANDKIKWTDFIGWMKSSVTRLVVDN